MRVVTVQRPCVTRLPMAIVVLDAELMAIAPTSLPVNVWLGPAKRVMWPTMVDVGPIPHSVSNHREAFYAPHVVTTTTAMAMPVSVSLVAAKSVSWAQIKAVMGIPPFATLAPMETSASDVVGTLIVMSLVLANA